MKLIHNKCKHGYTKRKGYTRKNGIYVKGSCVKSSSSSSSGRTRGKKQKQKRCPPGKISRNSYTRHVTRENGLRKTIRVKSSCVKNMGKVGKLAPGSPTIGPLKKGELSRFGYSYKNPESARHSSIRYAIKELGALNLYRKLDAVAKLTVLTSPKASQTFAADRDWIRAHYVLKA